MAEAAEFFGVFSFGVGREVLEAHRGGDGGVNGALGFYFGCLFECLGVCS